MGRRAVQPRFAATAPKRALLGIFGEDAVGLIYDRTDAFSADECDRIIALGEDGEPHPAPVYGRAGEEAVDTAVRDVQSTLVARHEAEWLFARLDAMFLAAAEAFGLPVGPIGEEIQILRYCEGDHFGTWHSDAGLDEI
ncbi:MAG TPA: hypothetical protein VK472_07960, partial [Allosphingosinicella sp.]|nr:hypothetical protein [Allosphingosinicella sp.]